MRVRIDSDRCQGHQMCAVVAPEIFGADDYGYAVILVEGDLTEQQQIQARRGAGNCPEQAVIIDE